MYRSYCRETVPLNLLTVQTVPLIVLTIHRQPGGESLGKGPASVYENVSLFNKGRLQKIFSIITIIIFNNFFGGEGGTTREENSKSRLVLWCERYLRTLYNFCLSVIAE